MDRVVEHAVKEFKDIQSEYNRLFSEQPIRDEDRAYDWFAKRLLQEKQTVSSLLDIACGGGYFLRQVRELTNGQVELTGIDLSDKALEIARQECPNADYALSAGEQLPFSDQQFDAVTCLGSLEHFMDIHASIQEMKRVTSGDAIFLILVPNIYWYKDILSVLIKGDRFARNQTHERFASWGEWKSILEEAGLKVYKTDKYNGIAQSGWKQWMKDRVIPTRFSYHFCFWCKKEG